MSSPKTFVPVATPNRESINPFRHRGDAPCPSVLAVARGMIAAPGLMDEVLRLLAWTGTERLAEIRAACDAAIAHRAEVEEACHAGTFARDWYGLPVLPD